MSGISASTLPDGGGAKFSSRIVPTGSRGRTGCGTASAARTGTARGVGRFLTAGGRLGFAAVARFLAAGVARFAVRRGLRRVAAERDGFARVALRRRAVAGFLRTAF